VAQRISYKLVRITREEMAVDVEVTAEELDTLTHAELEARAFTVGEGWTHDWYITERSMRADIVARRELEA
jgi:hypothetical protein